MRTVECKICHARVIPWSDFPDNLVELVSCAIGVHRYTVKGGQGVLYTAGEYDWEAAK